MPSGGSGTLDTMVTGRIATFAGDTGYGWVEAIGIRGGKVVATGTAADVDAASGPSTKRLSLAPDEIALPGFTDAHVHLIDTAIAAELLDLFAAPTLEGALDMVAAAAARIPAPAWILGSGWDQRRWSGWPHADMLERVAPGRHVALRSFDLHALWASPAALAAAGIDTTSPDPPGGIYRRDADGVPDGIMFEKASEVVLGRVPPPSPEALRRAIRSIGRDFLGYGVVGVHELGTLFPDTSNESLDVYAALAAAGELPIRLHAGVRADGLENALERGLRSGGPIGGSDPTRLAFGWLKLFADGTLGSRTAALLEPREGTDERGMFTNPPEFLRERTGRAAAGRHHDDDPHDRRRRRSPSPSTSSARPRRPARFMPRLEHVQLCHPDDRSAVRGARNCRLRPADSPPGGCSRRPPRLGRPRRIARLHLADAPRLRRDPRIRPGRAARTDRPVARHLARRHPPRPDLGRRLAIWPARGDHPGASAPRFDCRAVADREGPARWSPRARRTRGPDRASGRPARSRVLPRRDLICASAPHCPRRRDSPGAVAARHGDGDLSGDSW